MNPASGICRIQVQTAQVTLTREGSLSLQLNGYPSMVLVSIRVDSAMPAQDSSVDVLMHPPQGRLMTGTLKGTVFFQPTRYVNNVNSTKGSGYQLNVPSFSVRGNVSTAPKFVAAGTVSLQLTFVPLTTLLKTSVVEEQDTLKFLSGKPAFYYCSLASLCDPNTVLLLLQ